MSFKKKRLEEYLIILAIPSIILIIDLVIRNKIIQNMNQIQISFYILSFWFSILIYFLFLIILNRNYSKKTNVIIIIIISSFYTGVLVGSYSYFLYSGIMPNFFVISFLFHEPENWLSIVFDGAVWWMILLGVLLYVSICFLLYRIQIRLSQLKLIKRKRFRITVYLLLVFFMVIFHNNTRYNDQVYLSDVNSIVFISRNLYNIITGDRFGSAGLQARVLPKLIQSNKNSDFNILLIINESLRKKSMSIYGYRRNTTKNINSFLQKNKTSTFLFQNAFSNSSSTLISVPSILTGVSPIQPISLTHRSPLFWEYAKVLNLDTFFISSHSFKWNNLTGFFRNASIDYLWNREISGLKAYNDIGIDDRETLKIFQKKIQDFSKTNTKFAGVLHLNTNHFPYKIPNEYKKFDIEKDQIIVDDNSTYTVDAIFNQVEKNHLSYYDDSVYYMDTLFKQIETILENNQLLQNTIIIFTSDHGEALYEHGYLGHIESNHLETIAIPLFIYIPEVMIHRFPIDQLKNNLDKNVSNSDIIPTIIELMDIQENSDINKYSEKLVGSSLLQKIPNDRKIFIANNNETSIYKVGMSYIKDEYQYMIRTNSIPNKEELYNIKTDPDEKDNLWLKMNLVEKEKFRSELNSCDLCQEIYSSAELQ